ncbi:hypothetical protein QBC35DRAFT_447718 [Podospora australis]|uniref:Autophagy-related protein 33 n=1 Tax=Podospora australis TaxID=1536484 RepID=A0AAN6X2A8_9PEZI|nr:hypothetical protein QBC35DRAFT_447718 [Podospora australis]
MAGKGVSTLKFVGTVSLGLLTGLSSTLATLTVPSILSLPSAESASRAFDSLTEAANRRIRGLSAVSAASFLLAYYLSPKPARHPYLLYTTILIYSSQLAIADLVAPYLNLANPGPVLPSSENKKKRDERKKRADAAAARARMEASYEVLTTDVQSAPTSEDDAVLSEPETENGEEVRVKVETFIKKQIVQGAVLCMAFTMSIVGIWGDGVIPVYGSYTAVV